MVATGSWTRTVGDLRLTYLHDGDIEIVATGFFPGTTEADWAARPEHARSGEYLLAVTGALLVERGADRLLLDAGIGPTTTVAAESPPIFGAMGGGELPASCDAAGLDPTSVARVAFTHLHVDHVGWATTWSCDDGRGLFSAATWLVGTGEVDGPHREQALMLAGEGERTREVADGEEVLPGVRAWSLPGHTSGHTAWVLDDGRGGRVVAFGDGMHSPAQVEHPEWAVAVDGDRAAAEVARRTLLEVLAEPDTLGFGVHFAGAQLGRVVDGRWAPVGPAP